jgi:hypothetical protein
MKVNVGKGALWKIQSFFFFFFLNYWQCLSWHCCLWSRQRAIAWRNYWAKLTLRYVTSLIWIWWNCPPFPLVLHCEFITIRWFMWFWERTIDEVIEGFGHPCRSGGTCLCASCLLLCFGFLSHFLRSRLVYSQSNIWVLLMQLQLLKVLINSSMFCSEDWIAGTTGAHHADELF